MARVRVLGPDERDRRAAARPTPRSTSRAACRASSSRRAASRRPLSHGIHGRRRAGAGETFWQFRPFVAGEAAQRIDWRRSARDDRLYVREREWEAAQTVWLWIDRSASMGFVSDLAQAPKIERALVLGLALADTFVDGGERVGLLGLTRAAASRQIVETLAEAIVADRRRPRRRPAAAARRSRRFDEAVLISDFLSPADEIARGRRRHRRRAARAAISCMIVDPVEETFPFAGQAVLHDLEDGVALRVGDAGSWGAAYRDAHRGRIATRIAEPARRRGWTLTLHRTDRPASEAALRLVTLVAAARGGRTPADGRLTMLGLPLTFAAPLVLAALAALPALWLLLRVTPPQPRRIDFPPLSILLDLLPKRETPARTPWWLLLLRLPLAALLILAVAGPVWNPAPSGGGARRRCSWSSTTASPPRTTGASALGARRSSASRPPAREGRAVAIVATAERPAEIAAADPAAALERLRALKPQPHLADRARASRRDRALPRGDARRRDRLDQRRRRRRRRRTPSSRGWPGMADGRARHGAQGRARAGARARRRRERRRRISTARVVRAEPNGRDTRHRARPRPQEPAARRCAASPSPPARPRPRRASTLPIEVRNAIARLEIVGEGSAGAVAAARRARQAPPRRPRLRRHRPTRRSRCSRRPTTCRARSRPSPRCARAAAASPTPSRSCSTSRSRCWSSPMSARSTARRSARSTAFVEQRRRCCCASPARGSPPATTTSCRCACAAAAAARRRAVLGHAAHARALHRARARSSASTVPTISASAARSSPSPTPTSPRKTWAALARRHAARHRRPARRGPRRALPRHRRHDLVEPAAVGPLRRHAAPDRRRSPARADDVGAEAPRRRRRRPSRRDSHARRLRRASRRRPPTAQPVARDYAERAHATSIRPASTARPTRTLAVNALAPATRSRRSTSPPLGAPHRAARRRRDRSTCARRCSSLALLAAPRRHARLALARRPSRQPAAARRAGAAARRRSCSRCARARCAGAAPRAGAPAPAAAAPPIAATSLEAALVDAPRLCRHRRRAVDATSRAGLAGLTQVLASRTALEPGEPVGVDPARDELAFYPLLYWPIVAEPAAAERGRDPPARRLHEGRRHGDLRHPRRA